MNPIQTLIKDLADQHGRNRKNLLPVLQGVIQQENFLSEYTIVEIAREMDIPPAEVFGTATFTPSWKPNRPANTSSGSAKPLPVP